MPKQVQIEQTESEVEKEPPMPDNQNLDLKPYLTPEELEGGKLPPEEILSLPMFKVGKKQTYWLVKHNSRVGGIAHVRSWILQFYTFM